MVHSTSYTLRFAFMVCVVCSVFVAGSAVLLRERQEANKLLDRQSKVLAIAGITSADESLGRDEIAARFEERILARLVNLETGRYDASMDANTYDQRRALSDEGQSRRAPSNSAKVARLPHLAQVFHVMAEDGAVEMLILPISGKGLWSTLYGYLALDADATTVRGITFYEHGETPGLGGEVDNPRWKALWNNRLAFDETRTPRIEVIKGTAGPPDADPHHVDGLSGATITSRGVSHMLQLWLGPNGFGPYLEHHRKGGSI